MYYDSFDTWWWPFVFITLAGVLPTVIWRWAGALLAGNFNENSEGLLFVRCIATSLVAAVIAQFVFFPNGALAEVPLAIRMGAAFLGFATFVVSGQKLLLGIVVAEVVLISGALIAAG